MSSGCVEFAPDSWICTGPRGIVRRLVRHCPNCKRRRRFVQSYGGWYGDTLTCVACGDAWSEGQRMERPFARGWRKQAINHARAQWAAAMSPREFRAAIRADLEAMFA